MLLQPQHIFAHQRIGEPLGVLEVGGDPAAVHDDEAIGKLHDLVEVGGDQQHRHAGTGKLHQLFADEFGGADIDAAGGLIGDDEANAKDTAKTDKAGQPLTNAHDALYATTGNDSKTCYPTAYYTAVGTLNGQATKANTWYTTTSDTHNKAVSGNAEIKEVTEADKDYMLTYKMYLTLTNDSESYTGKLTVTPTITNTSESVKAMVVINGEKNIVDTNNTAFTTKGDVNLTSDNALEVTVYVYNDGNADNVNSTYFNGDATRLNGTVGLSFALETTNN